MQSQQLILRRWYWYGTMQLLMRGIESFSFRREQSAAEKIGQHLRISEEQNGVDELYGTPNGRTTFKERLSHARKEYDLFMYEHGRVIANASTSARRIGGYVEAGLILADKPKIAQAINVPISATDLIDGYSARKHKDGATVIGGIKDQEIDKERSLLVELALVAKGRMNWKHFALRVGSDWVMNKVVRPFFEERGIDTKAGLAGKAATTLVSAAEFSAMGNSNPESIQHIATGAKVGRVVIYTAQWGAALRKNRMVATPQEAMAA
ncbi:MAG: hypothetical protein H0W89_04110 [Candidatus Levybacteria bacterium]|nr:hypothetical protein [Candidatus Levybacteria bacterium]